MYVARAVYAVGLLGRELAGKPAEQAGTRYRKAEIDNAGGPPAPTPTWTRAPR